MNNGTKSLLSLVGLGQYCPPCFVIMLGFIGKEIALNEVDSCPQV